MRAPVAAEPDWKALSPLPMVNRRHEYEMTFHARRNHYEAMPKEPLLVRGVLGTPYVPAEPDGSVHLDAILGSMVLDSHPVPHHRDEEACVVPLPVELAWVSREGLPLWTCSDLRPQGELLRSQEYFHKRAPDARMDLATKTRLEVRRGRWKEYRMPLSTITVPELRAVCIGNAGEIMRLLSFVSHVGKKPSQGFGRVLQWKVSRWDVEIEEARSAALMARPVPVRAIMDIEGEVSLSPGTTWTRRGWRAPYWYAPNWEMAVTRE